MLDSNTKNTVDPEWSELYSDIVNSDQTVECSHCGYTLYGDEPRAMVICIPCWEKGVRNEE